MNPTNLWDRAIKRSVFDRSVDGALGAMRQAVRPFGQPRSAPPQSCHGRAAALVVLGLLALALPEAAQAQPVQTLISNFGQPVDSDVPEHNITLLLQVRALRPAPILRATVSTRFGYTFRLSTPRRLT